MNDTVLVSELNGAGQSLHQLCRLAVSQRSTGQARLQIAAVHELETDEGAALVFTDFVNSLPPGPIEIARISGSAARTGSAKVFFGFLGLVSLQLGIFNLLPIPILDGGVIALLLVEGLMRRDLSMALKEKIVHIGFVFLILLMGFALFNDLSKLVNFEKLFR